MKKSKGMLILVVFLSIMIGNMVGELISGYIGIFAKTVNISILTNGGNPWVLDVNFLKFTFGLVVQLNLGSILFLILGMLLFYKK
ncbi:MAG: DUF4321 domain-containing protein [Eubacteriales bacterium]